MRWSVIGRRMFTPVILDDEWREIERVVDRDDELRQRELDRLSKIEAQLKEKDLATRAVDNKNCFRCGASFNFLFRKRLACARCGHSVCGQCSVWDSAAKSSTCNFCCQQSILQAQNNLFKNEPSSSSSLQRRSSAGHDSDSDLESDSGCDPTSFCSRDNSLRNRRSTADIFAGSKNSFYQRANISGSEKETTPDVDERSEEIREHIECLVEKIINAELENANVQRLYDHPECLNIRHQRIELIVCSFLVALEHSLFSNSFYSSRGYDDRLLGCYQGRLSEALTQLGFSLHMAIANQPLTEGVTPTCAHFRLKQIVDEILAQVAHLPPMQDSEIFSPEPSSAMDNESTDFLYSQSYEDILATAVLNKVIENHQKRFASNDDRKSNGFASNSFANSKKDYANKNVKDEVRNQGDSTDSEGGTESAGDDFSWADRNTAETTSYTIKEEIEEITTTIENSESDGERHGGEKISESGTLSTTTVRDTGAGMPMDYFYAELDFNEAKKVPFPELGLDVVQAGEESEKKDVSLLVSDIDSWEENWRFKKKKVKKVSPYGNVRGRNVVCDDPVPMLIPNPHDALVRTRIGSRDIDDLSDLSEELPDTSDTDSELCFQPVEEKGEKLNDLNRNHASSPRPIPLPRKNKSTSADSRSVPKFVALESRLPPPKGLRLTAASGSVNVAQFGGVASLRCHATAKSSFDAAWFRGSELIKDGGRYHVFKEGTTRCLDVDDVDGTDDNKVYSCVAYNDDGEAWVDIQITIAVAIPEFVVQLVDCEVSIGSSAAFSCVVRGFPLPRVKWYCDEIELTPGPNVKIDCEHTKGSWSLRLDFVTEAVNGCEVLAVASNPLGQSISGATLRVANPSEIGSMTRRVNSTQDDVHKEAEKMLLSANQLSELSRQLDNVDNKISRLEAHFHLRTWEERQSELKRDTLHVTRAENSASAALREVTGRALDVVSSTQRVVEAEKSRRGSFPGSIAEREHQKWLHPTATIANNPYSVENLSRRASSGRRGEPASTLSPNLDDDVVDTAVSGETRELQLKSRYGRDYVVNEAGWPREKNDDSFKLTDSVNRTEERMYVAAGKISSLNDKLEDLRDQVEDVGDDTSSRRMCELEDKIITAAARVTHNDNKISIVETRVARLQKTMENSKPTKLQRSYSDRAWPSTPRTESRAQSTGGSWLTVETQNLRASSMEQLNVQTPTSDKRISPLSRKLSSSVTCLYRPSTSDVTISTHNVREEIPNLPSVKELVDRYQAGIEAIATPQSTLERRKKNVISVVNIEASDSPATEARNIIVVQKSNTARAPSEAFHHLPLSSSDVDSSSVRQLSRMFSESETADSPVKRLQVHSLTARSLSKEFRDAVKHSSPRRTRSSGFDEWNDNNLPATDEIECHVAKNSNSSPASSRERLSDAHGYASDEGVTYVSHHRKEFQ